MAADIISYLVLLFINNTQRALSKGCIRTLPHQRSPLHLLPFVPSAHGSP